MIPKLHYRWKIGGMDDYYANEVFNRLKTGDYYWVNATNNIYKVICKFGNYVWGVKVKYE